MRIQITGSRDFTDFSIVQSAIVRTIEDSGAITYNSWVVHGGARGADTLADRIAKRIGCEVEVFPANWNRYGKMAGHIRNVEMLDTDPDIVLAFFKRGAGNRGTQNLVNEARRRGIPIKEYWEE